MGHQSGRLCDCDECCRFTDWARQAVAGWPTLTDDQIALLVTILRKAALGR